MFFSISSGKSLFEIKSIYISQLIVVNPKEGGGGNYLPSNGSRPDLNFRIISGTSWKTRGFPTIVGSVSVIMCSQTI
jgi:hypothetical protein